jgi:hypothetical protein
MRGDAVKYTGKFIYFSIDQNNRGHLQLAINNPSGSGYRISGPKYDGTGKTLHIHQLTSRDIVELRSYLDAAESRLEETKAREAMP